MALENVRKHEVAFCAEVSKWADRLFGRKGDLPFGSSDIESFGRGSHKRQDFRVYALWVEKPLKDLKGNLAHRYLSWESKQTFASRKSKAVPVPLRATCAARPLWYDLT